MRNELCPCLLFFAFFSGVIPCFVLESDINPIFSGTLRSLRLQHDLCTHNFSSALGVLLWEGSVSFNVTTRDLGDIFVVYFDILFVSGRYCLLVETGAGYRESFVFLVHPGPPHPPSTAIAGLGSTQATHGSTANFFTVQPRDAFLNEQSDASVRVALSKGIASVFVGRPDDNMRVVKYTLSPCAPAEVKIYLFVDNVLIDLLKVPVLAGPAQATRLSLSLPKRVVVAGTPFRITVNSNIPFNNTLSVLAHLNDSTATMPPNQYTCEGRRACSIFLCLNVSGPYAIRVFVLEQEIAGSPGTMDVVSGPAVTCTSVLSHQVLHVGSLLRVAFSDCRDRFANPTSSKNNNITISAPAWLDDPRKVPPGACRGSHSAPACEKAIALNETAIAYCVDVVATSVGSFGLAVTVNGVTAAALDVTVKAVNTVSLFSKNYPTPYYYLRYDASAPRELSPASLSASISASTCTEILLQQAAGVHCPPSCLSFAYMRGPPSVNRRHHFHPTRCQATAMWVQHILNNGNTDTEDMGFGSGSYKWGSELPSVLDRLLSKLLDATTPIFITIDILQMRSPTEEKPGWDFNYDHFPGHIFVVQRNPEGRYRVYQSFILVYSLQHWLDSGHRYAGWLSFDEIRTFLHTLQRYLLAPKWDNRTRTDFTHCFGAPADLPNDSDVLWGVQWYGNDYKEEECRHRIHKCAFCLCCSHENQQMYGQDVVLEGTPVKFVQ